MIEALYPVFHHDKKRFAQAYEKLILLPHSSKDRNSNYGLAPWITFQGVEIFYYISHQIPNLADKIIWTLLLTNDAYFKQIACYFISFDFFLKNKRNCLFHLFRFSRPLYRKIIANMSAETLKNTEKKDVNIALLKQFFYDFDLTVKKEAARFIAHIESDEIDTYRHLIIEYIKSPAFHGDDFHLFNLLKKATVDIFDCLRIMGDKFIVLLKTDSHRLFHLDDFIDLLMRYYVQSESDQTRRKIILDILDSLLQSNYYDVVKHIVTYDR
jgi:hypothetical protein